MAQGGLPPSVALPERFNVSDTGKIVTLAQAKKLSPEKRRSLWFVHTWPDGTKGTLFPFYDDTGVVPAGSFEDYAAGRSAIKPQTPVDVLPADRHPVAVYIAALAPGSRRAMSNALNKVARLLGSADALHVPWWELRYQHTQAVRSKLAAPDLDTGKTAAPSSINQALSALRGVIKECARLGLMSHEAAASAADIKSVKGHREPRGRALAVGEIRALFQSCDPVTTLGTRDAALLAVLYGCGLRRAEVAALDVTDYDADAGTLRVLGKGNKQRTAPMPAGAVDALNAWLDLRGEHPEEPRTWSSKEREDWPDAGPIFCPVRKDACDVGSIVPQRLTPDGIHNALSRLATRAGVKGFSPHDARRTFIGDMLDAGADLAVVQRAAGHASPVTTSAYDRRGLAAVARAVSKIHVPFARRAS